MKEPKPKKPKALSTRRIKPVEHINFKYECDLYNELVDRLTEKYPNGIPDKEQELAYNTLRLFQLDKKPNKDSDIYLLCEELGIKEKLFK